MTARPTPSVRFAFVVLTILALLVASAPGSAHRQAQAKEPAVEVYASIVDGNLDGTTFTALDPRTLEDRSGVPVVDIGDRDSMWGRALSADGSTFATVVGDDFEVVIRDGLDGPERLRFSAGGPPFGLAALSADGSRLVLRVGIAADGGGYSQLPSWKLFDTDTGEVIATTEGGDVSGSNEKIIVDADATRLYRLLVPGEADMSKLTGPRPVLLVAYDLTTGTEVGRLDLPEVMAGAWQRSEGGYAQLDPAIAVSADGRRLAIAHADDEVVTLIDAQRLEVEQMLALTRPTSLTQRLLGLVPLLPQDAAAKVQEGTFLEAVFAPDGRHLYLFGTESTVDGDGQPDYHWLGLRIVNVETGEVEAQVLDGSLIMQVIPTPDGSSVYVTGIKHAGRSPAAIWRLNGETGQVGAQRLFRNGGDVHIPFVFLRPRAAGR